MSKAGRYFDGLPAWARGLSFIILLVLAVAILLFVKKGINKLIAIAKADRRLNEVNVEIVALEKNGQKQSFSESQYTAFADAIFVAMDGMATDEPSINAIFRKMNNDLDVYKLITAFGSRTISSGLFWEDDFTGTLPEAINSELDTIEKQYLTIS